MTITIEECQERSKCLEDDFVFTHCKWGRLLSSVQEELNQYVAWGWDKRDDLMQNDVKTQALYGAVMYAISCNGSSGVAYGVTFSKNSFHFGNDFTNNEKNIPWSQWR